VKDREYPFDLKYINRIDVNVLIYKFLEFFELPQLEPIQKGYLIYPEEKFLYKGSNLWVSPTPNGINSFRFNEDSKNISEEVTIFPSIESWYSWEYWGIKNRKRCKLCNKLLPKGYKGKYCSKEYDPECRKRYERLKKRGTLP
jgi:hypothetical protein